MILGYEENKAACETITSCHQISLLSAGPQVVFEDYI